MPSGPGAKKVWKEAYAEAKRLGYSNFKKGSYGHRRVREIAEAIARKRG